MKNNTLFLYIAGVFALISCGTTSHASYSGTKYQNSIYYTPDANAQYAEAQGKEELQNLQNKTKNTFGNSTQQSIYDRKTNVETIYIGDTNLVNISYNPNVNYSIVDDDESYEARLKKFDSPTYSVNIEIDNNPYNYYPWWDVGFGWYRPYGITMGTGWYNPWWGSYYSWYGPQWGNPWYGPSWGWNSWYGWYDPWYGGGWNGWHDPWHQHYPVYSNRDVYYGRRNSSPSYNNNIANSRPVANSGGSYTRRDPSINQIRGNGNYVGRNPNTSQSANTGGSVYRRGSQGYNGAVYNNNAANKGQGTTTVQPGYRPSGNNGATSSQGSMYRRSATKSAVSTGNTNNSTRRENYNNNNSNYNNNNNTNYNRNTYSPPARSSSGTSGGGTSTSGGGTRSGGSSYRR